MTAVFLSEMLARARRSSRLLALVGLLAAADAFAQTRMEIGRPAPPMVAITFDGRTFDLKALKGKVVLVNFWATWCVPCRKDMPVLAEFYRRHGEGKLALIAISVDRPQYREQARRTMSALGCPAGMLTDIETREFEPPDGVPSTFVVDSAGMVRDRLIAIDSALLAKVVVPLLAQADASRPIAR